MHNVLLIYSQWEANILCSHITFHRSPFIEEQSPDYFIQENQVWYNLLKDHITMRKHWKVQFEQSLERMSKMTDEYDEDDVEDLRDELMDAIWKPPTQPP